MTALLRLAMAATLVLGLAACEDDPEDANRQVVDVTSPGGHSFTFMPVMEEGVTQVAISVAWRSDWIADPARNPAVPDVARRMLQAPESRALTAQSARERLSAAGARLEIQTRPDHTLVDLTFEAGQGETAVPLVRAVLAEPRFDADRLAETTTALRETMARARGNAGVAMWEAGRITALGADGPVYRFLTLPDLDQISGVGPGDLAAFHDRTFTQNPEALIVSGALDRAQAGALVDQLLTDLPDRALPPALTSPVDPTARRIYLHRPDATSTQVGLVAALSAPEEDAGHIDRVAVRMLHEGTSAPLFKAFQSQMRATYGVTAGLDNYARANRLFYLAGEIEGDRLDEALGVILQTYDQFRAAPPQDRLERFRDLHAQTLSSSAAYVDVGARMMRERSLDGRDPAGVFGLADRTAALTTEALTARLGSAFPPSAGLTVLATGPNPADLPGACVITDVSQAPAC